MLVCTTYAENLWLLWAVTTKKSKQWRLCGVGGFNYVIVFFSKGPFIYYVIIFLGFLDPPLPLHQHVFSTKNKQKLAFSDPPSPLQVLT